jgi:hypothetical protein
LNQNIIARSLARVMPAARATGLFVSLATFQSSDAADFPDGFYSGSFQNVPGLVNLPCTAPPVSEARLQATESKALQDITASELRHVLFDRFIPQLDAGWREGWRVVIQESDGLGGFEPGVAYDVLGVESDSQSKMSRCEVRLTTI